MRAPFFMTERDESLLSDVASAKKTTVGNADRRFQKF